MNTKVYPIKKANKFGGRVFQLQLQIPKDVEERLND